MRISARASWCASRITRKYYVYRSRSKPRRIVCGRREERGEEAAREKERRRERKKRSNEGEREGWGRGEEGREQEDRRATYASGEIDVRIPFKRTDKKDSGKSGARLNVDWLDRTIPRQPDDDLFPDMSGNEPIRLVRSLFASRSANGTSIATAAHLRSEQEVEVIERSSCIAHRTSLFPWATHRVAARKKHYFKAARGISWKRERETSNRFSVATLTIVSRACSSLTFCIKLRSRNIRNAIRYKGEGNIQRKVSCIKKKKHSFLLLYALLS